MTDLLCELVESIIAVMNVAFFILFTTTWPVSHDNSELYTTTVDLFYLLQWS